MVHIVNGPGVDALCDYRHSCARRDGSPKEEWLQVWLSPAPDGSAPLTRTYLTFDWRRLGNLENLHQQLVGSLSPHCASPKAWNYWLRRRRDVTCHYDTISCSGEVQFASNPTFVRDFFARLFGRRVRVSS